MHCKFRFSTSFLLVVIGANLCSAVDIPLINANFEDPAAPKTVGDSTWSNISGWTSTGPSSDSGLEAFSSEPQPDLGANIAFLQSGDGAIFQTSSYSIQSGDNFALSFFERIDFNATELTVRFYYDNGSRNVFDTQVIDLTGGIGREGPLAQRSVTTAATGPSVGSLLGVEFENTSNGGANGTWGWIDNISLLTVGGPGDVDEDGDVDEFDFGIIRDNFRMDVASRTLGDLDLSGTVDFLDFIEWRENATPAALAAAGFPVPEPASTLLAIIATSLIGCVRRQKSTS